MSKPRVSTFLWFDNSARKAAEFYVSLLPNARILSVSGFGANEPGKEGSFTSVTFELDGQRYIALNGGPQFKLNEAVSIFVRCATQDEIDRLWSKLLDGGTEQRCGWIKDRFGLCWQIVPSMLGDMLQDKDAARAKRVMDAMLGMVKLDIAGLQRAYDG
jgi:predicted 3-demethylubiquinone-9 3-methyltransferase (glyoxalase superfamily)